MVRDGYYTSELRERATFSTQDPPPGVAFPEIVTCIAIVASRRCAHEHQRPGLGHASPSPVGKYLNEESATIISVTFTDFERANFLSLNEHFKRRLPVKTPTSRFLPMRWVQCMPTGNGM